MSDRQVSTQAAVVGLLVNIAYTVITVIAAYILAPTHMLLAICLGSMAGLQIVGLIGEVRKL